MRQVLTLKEKGFEEKEICAVTDLDDHVIKRIIEDEDEIQSITRKHWLEKIPTMKSIVGLGLEGILTTLREMMDPDIRHYMIKDIKDLAALTKIVAEINMLLRLEEGKSTQNVAVNRTYQETKAALEDLAKVDPVFQYKIPHDEKPETTN